MGSFSYATPFLVVCFIERKNVLLYESSAKRTENSEQMYAKTFLFLNKWLTVDLEVISEAN